MNTSLKNAEFRSLWKDIYIAAIRAGNDSFSACNKADTAVLDLIRRDQ